MKISVFLSYPKPFKKEQEQFIQEVSDFLERRGFEARTLGVTDYDMNAPLTAIRRLMLESNGILTIAFRRTYVKHGTSKPESDIMEPSISVNHQWFTSPWCHIEPAMAYQIGLPILVFREKGVMADGILEKGVTGTYLPEFDLDKPVDGYLESEEWKQIIGSWEGRVRKVVEIKGQPPLLY